MEGFKEAGVNVEDPLEMVMVLRHFDPAKFERFSSQHGAVWLLRAVCSDGAWT